MQKCLDYQEYFGISQQDYSKHMWKNRRSPQLLCDEGERVDKPVISAHKISGRYKKERFYSA